MPRSRTPYSSILRPRASPSSWTRSTVDAEHTCMTARGVKKIGSSTVTYAVRGEMDPAAVAMLLAYAGEKK